MLYKIEISIIMARGDVMKKILIVLFIIGLAIYITRDNEEKQKRKEYNIEQIEKNIEPYQIKE